MTDFWLKLNKRRTKSITANFLATSWLQPYQQVFEPLRPHPPVQPQVLGEEAGDVLPPSVRHKARGSQLPHVGIDKRNPGFALCRDKRKVN